MLIYNEDTGKIIAKLPPDQPYSYLGSSVKAYYSSDAIPNWREYRFANGKLSKMSEIESYEMRVYDRVLSEQERLQHRLIEELTPTKDEVQKAKVTIEVLELLSEVL